MTVCTEGFWQAFTAVPDVDGPPYRDRFAAAIAENCFLTLPLRTLPGPGDRAVASLIINQASLDVVDRLAREMADRCRALRAEVVVGLPTLGLALAPQVARHLGFQNYVALGYSRKFWYDDGLSIDIQSITSPGQGKRVYLDPNLVPRLQGRRTLVVDDVISRGTSITAAHRLLELVSTNIVGSVVAMTQTDAWRQSVGRHELRSVFATPLFERRRDAWWPSTES
jgi:adenine/guanine phosphoribosyltransferase-like PRPP-binding protein